MTINEEEIKILEQDLKDMNETLDTDMKALKDATMWVTKDLMEIRLLEAKLVELKGF